MSRPAHNWTADQVQYLQAHYPDSSTAELARHLGLSESQVHFKAYALGLKKSPAHTAALRAQRIAKLVAAGASSRFQAGGTSWNKGRAGTYSNTSATKFQSGNRPHTWCPIGTERWRGGYLARKCTDTGYPPRDWVFVHRLVWESAHGPVPPDHAIVFRDGNRQNITLDNLELIARSDLMRRNSVHNLPQPLKEVLAIKRWITRTINERKEITAHGQ